MQGSGIREPGRQVGRQLGIELVEWPQRRERGAHRGGFLGGQETLDCARACQRLLHLRSHTSEGGRTQVVCSESA